MSGLIAWLMVICAALALLAAMLLLARSLHALISGVSWQASPPEALQVRNTALLQRKAGLFRDLQELSFDLEAQKLSQEDYQELEKGLRREIANIMRERDELLAEGRKEADVLIESRLHGRELRASEPE